MAEDDEVYADEMPELADDDMAMEDEFEPTVKKTMNENFIREVNKTKRLL